MQKLLYTEEGLNIMRSRGSDSPSKNGTGLGEKSTQLSQVKVQGLSRQCNRVRVKTLKNAFNLSVPENLLQALPFTRFMKGRSGVAGGGGIPHVLSMEQLQQGQHKEEDVLQLAASQLHSATALSRRDGISRHHEQSIRLRTGDWYQWKNLPMSPRVVDDFQKQLKLHHISEEESRMRKEKKLNQHQFEMEKVEQVQKRTKEQLCEVLEKKSLNFNVELDDFWKEMKENTKYFGRHKQEMQKSRQSLLQRLEKCKKKFAVKKCYIPNFSKLQADQGTKYYDL